MALLARREHSRVELRRKLQKSCADQDVLEQVLDALAGERLQSDARHAQSYARQRAERGYGPMRIALELQERGVGKEVAAAAIKAVETDWVHLARAARAKHFGQQLPFSPAERAKQLKFLRYRGFDADVVRKA
ncbi:MAG: regulatory protein RecX, partial [Gammaproteobacteria bacterium]